MEEPGKRINDLVAEIIEFRDKRDWSKFHSIENLLLGLNIECSELQEIFLWKLNQGDNIEVDHSDLKSKVSDELADIFIFLSYIAHQFEINLSKAIDQKLLKTKAKYPIEKSFGSNKKYNEL